MRLKDVNTNYNRAAYYYDCMTEAVFGFLLGAEKHREIVVNLLGELDGATVLDLGCGTGRNFPLLADKVGEQGKVIGVDYSEGMLQKARKRIEREGWKNIELVRDDVANLDAIDGPFDVVIAVWVMGIVHDFQSGLSNAVRCLARGGRLAIIDFEKSRPDHGLLRWLFPAYSIALRVAGVDSAEDLDNVALQQIWKHGRKLLSEKLEDLTVQHYLSGTGLIIFGTKPTSLH